MVHSWTGMDLDVPTVSMSWYHSLEGKEKAGEAYACVFFYGGPRMSTNLFLVWLFFGPFFFVLLFI